MEYETSFVVLRPIDEVFAFTTNQRTSRSGFTIKAEPGGFVKVAEPVLLNLYKRQAEAETASLKEFMEAGLDRSL
jgi:hypothetical protein